MLIGPQYQMHLTVRRMIVFNIRRDIVSWDREFPNEGILQLIAVAIKHCLKRSWPKKPSLLRNGCERLWTLDELVLTCLAQAAVFVRVFEDALSKFVLDDCDVSDVVWDGFTRFEVSFFERRRMQL